MSSTLLMSWEDEIEVFRVIQGVKNGKNSSSWVTNCQYVSVCQLKNLLALAHTNVLHILPQHHLMEDLSSSHSNKGVIQFLGLVGPQR